MRMGYAPQTCGRGGPPPQHPRPRAIAPGPQKNAGGYCAIVLPASAVINYCWGTARCAGTRLLVLPHLRIVGAYSYTRVRVLGSRSLVPLSPWRSVLGSRSRQFPRYVL
jgi:hypothetical protein